MDRMEFSAIRHYLGKSQAQTARLLGVSSKAVQSFEQGWRNTPPHCERQMLFLLYLTIASQKSVEPCWDIKQCDSQTRMKCIAWQSRAGHLCWFINGTVCEG